ncbi:MAG: hypothetical protein IKL36_03625 [Clostridia bacterium]|nr:hypothetical protein [Clostridia bacterium]
MEFIKKNRSAAALILVVVIVLSVLFGSWRSVSGIANELEREFTKKDKYGETVKGTFDALIMHINVFVSEYEAVLGACPEITALREYAELSSEDGTESPAAFTDVDFIRNSAVLMHQRLDKSGNYTAEAKAAYAGIDNAVSILKKYDSYNAAAKKYNDAAETIGGSLFGLQRAIEF